jgi:L,D-peptidoglycan transpeptidase YkuD (ErfK/YbiS/YcfS/YnhG family)
VAPARRSRPPAKALALTLVVGGASAARPIGLLRVAGCAIPCAVGSGGRRVLKREGDGATPVGTWVCRRVLYRPDRGPRPGSGLPVAALRAADGWCDAPGDRNYNRPVRHPYPASAERLWRGDGLYDIIVVLGHNDRPRVRGLGSAVFLHAAGAGLAPTAGCVALPIRLLRRLVQRLGRGSRIRVLA